MRPLLRILLGCLVAVTGLAAGASPRLTYTMGGAPTTLYWPQASFPINYDIEPRLAAAIGAPTVDAAFEAWTRVDGASIAFRSHGAVDGTKPGYDGKNTVTFIDSLFKDQGLIAMTSYWNDSSGRLTEADIQVDPAYVGSVYPAGPTIEHEVGHLLGLDHSAVLSSIMYPFISKSQSGDLDLDDRISIATLYPKIDPTLAGATLTGRVSAGGTGVFAAEVVAVNESGQPVATALSEASGDFTLEAIPPGEYRIYAEPLDGPVTPRNLSGVYSDAKVTSFPTRFVSSEPLTVDAGKVYGNLMVDATGAAVDLNPRWIGLSDAGSTSFSLYSTAVTLRGGQTAEIAVGGDGFIGGMTTFSVMNPAVKRTSDFHYAGNYVYATFEVAGDAVPGSAVVLVRSGNDTATLTGAVRVVNASGSKARVVRR